MYSNGKGGIQRNKTNKTLAVLFLLVYFLSFCHFTEASCLERRVGARGEVGRLDSFPRSLSRQTRLPQAVLAFILVLLVALVVVVVMVVCMAR